jgi:hypothetical protein
MDKRTWAHNRETIMGFWILGDDQKFRQGRLSDERKYVDQKRNINSANGQASALKRKERDATAVQRNVNETSTPTPTPTILFTDVNNIKQKSEKFKKPDDVSDGVWEDFVKHRKAKKAPVTETVINSIKREADKIGWPLDKALAEVCARGWQGFKAEWINQNLKGNQNATSHHNLTKAQRADIALGIVNPGTDERMDGSTSDAFAPILRQLTEIR